jgi:NADPH:quinone reductase-like Zn-dependent oxidoreductase
VVDTVFPLERAADAHRQMAANANVGKIVLSVP